MRYFASGSTGDSMTKDWLPEQLKTIRNLTEIADILIKNRKKELLPTVLELMLVECQQVVDENCVVKNGR